MGFGEDEPHSCEPNVRLMPGTSGQLIVLAALNISPGEAPFCLTYMSWRFLFKTYCI